MTTAIRTTQTDTSTIQISLTREVNEKTAYLDGYNLPIGKETYEKYEVVIIHKTTGKRIRTVGKPGGFAFFDTASKFTKLPAGAYARIGNAYVGKGIYDIAMTMIAELDAEVGIDPEYSEVQAAEIAKEQAAKKALEAEAKEYAREIKNGLCPKCRTYCYGDCTAN